MIRKDLDISIQWENLKRQLEVIIGKKPADLNGVLFLIGVQELGQGHKVFSKEEKQDLIHLGVCKVLSQDGFYHLHGSDKDGWPIWKVVQKIPHLTLSEQEKLLKINVIEYFTKELNLDL